MGWLEHRIPPPVVAAVAGAGMWAIGRISPRLEFAAGIRTPVAIVLSAFGIIVAVLGALEFRKAGTTLHALNLQASSSLVATGVYRYSRNPIYLGLVSVLLGWAIHLAAPFALLGPILFVLFINRFQIIPEERALRAKFGLEFVEYERKVRRWL